MIDTGLNGKVVLLTGGNNPSGIGAATALAFAAQQAKIFIHFFSSSGFENGEGSQPGENFYRAQQAKSAEPVVSSIRSGGAAAESWEIDLGDPAAASELFDRAESTFGPVSVLVNNAAHCNPDTFQPAELLGNNARAADTFPMRAITAQSVDRHFAVNSRAPALLMAEFARRHAQRRESWGRIINISTDGAAGFATEVSYGASKYALESFSRAAAKELAVYGITVNTVSLGPIQTGWISPELEKQVVPTIPLGRLGRPEDVADVIVFLASQQARWITGQVIYVGGGHRMPH